MNTTRKGQEIIPKPVRKILGVRSGQPVTFWVIENNKIELKPVRSLLDLKGTLKVPILLRGQTDRD